MTSRTRVVMTRAESSPGVPYFDPNAVITDVPAGQTGISIENLVAGERYWVKVWNEDEFGNRSREVVTPVNTYAPMQRDLVQFSANGVLDDTSPMYAYVKVPADIKDVQSVAVTLAFRQFFASARTAASSGTLTSNTDGTSTTPSGGSSTSASGAGTFGVVVENVPGIGTFSGAAPDDVLVNAVGTLSHTHATPSHTHTTPDHAHNIAGHTHTLVYGTFEEAMPASHSVFVQVYKRESSAWHLVHSEAVTGDLVDLNLYQIDGPGDWRIAVISDTGQPNNGRLGCDLFGSIAMLS